MNAPIIATISVMIFSFFAGWSISFAVKTLMKVIMLLLGLIVGAIIALQYAEVLPAVNWLRVAELSSDTVTAIKSESIGLLEFAMNALPGTVAFAIGAWFSWVRH